MDIARNGKTIATVKKALVTPLRGRFSVKVAGGGDMDVDGNVLPMADKDKYRCFIVVKYPKKDAADAALKAVHGAWPKRRWSTCGMPR